MPVCFEDLFEHPLVTVHMMPEHLCLYRTNATEDACLVTIPSFSPMGFLGEHFKIDIPKSL